jgi:hypothetical protein
MNDQLLAFRVGILMMLDNISPRAAEWLNERDPHSERGDITAQNAIWIAIAAAGAFAVAVILYNKFKTKANDLEVNNPGPLPVNP